MGLSRKYLFIIVLSLGYFGALEAQQITREEYIRLYSGWAMEEMNRSGIPASITLAQGMLESNNGNSRLAMKANNHFGIKCHGWKGKKIIHDDDEKNECFRKYKSAEESFTDHTEFLMNTPRYSSLFLLAQDDYEGWARGLKQAGYATAPTYADLLIGIIAENELYEFDKGQRLAGPVAKPELTDVDNFEVSVGRKILVRNRINYIVVREDDTYQSLSEELDLLPFELAKYNEIKKGSKLHEGRVLYLQPKRSKASVEFRYHEVDDGETMYDISQMYGIKLKKLLSMNLMQPGDEPSPGDEINLRKKKQPDERAEPASTDESDESDES